MAPRVCVAKEGEGHIVYNFLAAGVRLLYVRPDQKVGGREWETDTFRALHRDMLLGTVRIIRRKPEAIASTASHCLLSSCCITMYFMCRMIVL